MFVNKKYKSNHISYFLLFFFELIRSMRKSPHNFFVEVLFTKEFFYSRRWSPAELISQFRKIIIHIHSMHIITTSISSSQSYRTTKGKNRDGKKWRVYEQQRHQNLSKKWGVHQISYRGLRSLLLLSFCSVFGSLRRETKKLWLLAPHFLWKCGEFFALFEQLLRV